MGPRDKQIAATLAFVSCLLLNVMILSSAIDAERLVLRLEYQAGREFSPWELYDNETYHTAANNHFRDVAGVSLPFSAVLHPAVREFRVAGSRLLPTSSGTPSVVLRALDPPWHRDRNDPASLDGDSENRGSP